jgi:hypothetical protein
MFPRESQNLFLLSCIPDQTKLSFVTYTTQPHLVKDQRMIYYSCNTFTIHPPNMGLNPNFFLRSRFCP